MKQFLLGLLVIMMLNQAKAATPDSSDVIVPYTGLFPKQESEKLYRFGVGGFYRFFGTYTQMDNPYLVASPSFFTQDKNVFIGDDSQLPNLNLNFSGRPTEQTSWGFDVYAFQFLDGAVDQAYSGQTATNLRPTIYNPRNGRRLAGNMNMLLGMNLYGSHSNEYGSFNVGFGGLQWVSISDLTLGAFVGYNRFTLFERNPWDPVTTTVNDRYSSYFNEGNINQDARFGERAFQGFNFAAQGLPGNINIHLLYGKTDINGGFLTIPNSSYGGQIQKIFDDGSFVAFNTFNNLTYTDSLSSERIGFNVYTLQYNKTYKNEIELQFEGGMGQYFSPFHNLGWGELLNAKLRLPKEVSGIPLEVHVFRVSNNVINNNAIYWNTAFEEAVVNDIPAGQIGSTNVLQPFASSMAPIGAITNNRQGINLNSEININKLKLSLAIGMAGELAGRSNQIALSHPVNQLTRSRIWRWNFPQQVGPYGRYNVAYRDVFDLIQLRDDSLGTVIHPKRFSVMEVQAKYSTQLFHRDLHFFMLNRYSSVQRQWSPITVFNSSAYVRQYSNELEAYYNIRKRVILAGYLGYEKVMGNYETELDAETFKPRNQEGLGFGLGLDISLGKNAGLYLRHRWFSFTDRNFSLDQFSGQETLAEIKIFF